MPLSAAFRFRLSFATAALCYMLLRFFRYLPHCFCCRRHIFSLYSAAAAAVVALFEARYSARCARCRRYRRSAARAFAVTGSDEVRGRYAPRYVALQRFFFARKTSDTPCCVLQRYVAARQRRAQMLLFFTESISDCSASPAFRHISAASSLHDASPLPP